MRSLASILILGLSALTPLTAPGADVALPAPNPWAASGPYPMSHHNPGQTDVTVVDGPTRSKQLMAVDAKTVPDTYLAPGGREMTRALNAAAIGPAHRAAPEIFTRHHADICRLAIEKWDALMPAWYDGPLTLIHGDSHLANCFEYPTPGGPRIGMIDFQGLQWCKGIRDVQYHLINSLEPEVLAEHEDELIDYYVAELAGRGVALDPADAREQYRAYSFQTLMVAVVSIGLGSLTERDETVRTVLRRSVAAIDRLRFGDWLGGLP